MYECVNHLGRARHTLTLTLRIAHIDVWSVCVRVCMSVCLCACVQAYIQTETYQPVAWSAAGQVGANIIQYALTKRYFTHHYTMSTCIYVKKYLIYKMCYNADYIKPNIDFTVQGTMLYL